MWIRQFADAVAFGALSLSAPISREYLVTSAARIAVRRRTGSLQGYPVTGIPTAIHWRYFCSMIQTPFQPSDGGLSR